MYLIKDSCLDYIFLKLSKLNNEETNNPTLKTDNDSTRHSTKEDIQKGKNQKMLKII